MRYLILTVFISACNKWDIAKKFGIHKFDINDCIIHAKDYDNPYKIIKFEKDGYLAYNINNPKYTTIVKYGKWEESYFEKVDCK